MKRYVSERGSDEVRAAMGRARWLTSRLTYVETMRAVSLRSRPKDGAPRAFAAEWPSFDVVELTAEVADQAADLAVRTQLRSLDAIHLASASIVGADGLVFATWDERLHAAASEQGWGMLPERL